MPVPVRALWEGASEEERERAHRTSVAILESWLGKATREEAAARVGVAPLRFWQLSQQAVAGMVAGLLRQPRWRRGRDAAAVASPDAEVLALRTRVKELEKELEESRRLVGVLRDLPGHREGTGNPSSPAARARGDGTRSGARKRKRRRSALARGAPRGGTPPPPGGASGAGSAPDGGASVGS